MYSTLRAHQQQEQHFDKSPPSPPSPQPLLQVMLTQPPPPLQHHLDDDRENDICDDGTNRKKKRRNDERSVTTTLPPNIEHVYPTSSNSGNNSERNAYDNGSRATKWIANIARYRIRILGRRYSLTKTFYKFIDVGIAVRFPSRVDIIIGDYHGKEINLSPDAWSRLMDEKHAIMSHLRRSSSGGGRCLNDDENTRNQASKTIVAAGLTLRFGRLNNLPILRLDTLKTRIVLSMNTVLAMFDLEHCINFIAATLCQITDKVDAKLSRFVAIASMVPDPANVPRVIRESEFFDRTDIVDCELIALCFGMAEKL